MLSNQITIQGARVHNLKNINVSIPKNQLVVITGLSGSGKSSLAFDTIYAEGQRRYVESLSAYARQFLGLMEKPDVDSIEGLSPAISIEQKGLSHNPRSTVATVTEIYDYLRLMYARIGTPHCYQCGKKIEAQTVQDIVDRLLNLGDGIKLSVLAPVVTQRKGTHQQLLEELRKQGFLRVKLNDQLIMLEDHIALDKNKKHTIDVYVDRIKLKDGIKGRLTESVEMALQLGKGILKIEHEDGHTELMSEHFTCLDCNISLPDITPALFSFNSPQGACPECSGLGFRLEFDPDLVVPDSSLSIYQGALKPWSGKHGNYYYQMLENVCQHHNQDIHTPWKDLPDSFKHVVLYGSKGKEIEFVLSGANMEHSYRRPFEGVIPNMMRRYKETTSDYMRQEISRYQRQILCEECGGARLRPEARSVFIEDMPIFKFAGLSIEKAAKFINSLKLKGQQEVIAAPIQKELKQRLGFLRDVGLSYLTLDRASASLSGGEGQRIRLATQIGSALTGVVYVLDEPSIGLHPRDNQKLLETLFRLRDLGNTVVVVEHDEETIRHADHVIDLGPGAGRHGGEVVCVGTVQDMISCKKSLTGAFLSGRDFIEIPKTRKKKTKEKTITIINAQHNNLKKINVEIPLGMFVCVTGVSGSGKSSLINDTLYPALKKRLYGGTAQIGKHDTIKGVENVDKVVAIDQSPIGRTPRSNPATYTQIFTHIRNLFAQLPESKARGYAPGRYSFNVKGGRCEHCEGDGLLRIEMHFLPDVHVTCEVCDGRRYNRETLEIKYRNKSIADVLEMTINEALEFFAATPAIKNRLQTLKDVGLGYIKLGQSATTLSGGEAQRVKLSRELSKKGTGNTLYLLDEPTTGLHFADVRNLIDVLHRLVLSGNTVLVIEHNTDVMKSADYIIDLGPEGGAKGGKLVDSGTPEQIAKKQKGHTGNFLRKVLEAS